MENETFKNLLSNPELIFCGIFASSLDADHIGRVMEHPGVDKAYIKFNKLKLCTDFYFIPYFIFRTEMSAYKVSVKPIFTNGTECW